MEAKDYRNGTAPKSILYFVEGMWLSRDQARRIRAAFEYVRSRGGVIHGTEGYRWLGVPADRRIGARGLSSAYTSDKTSNQWYQQGREDSGLTPSAAVPGTSNHGKCEATDTSTDSPKLRKEAFRLVGMTFNVPSESWHSIITGPPLVDLSAYDYGFAGGPVTILPEHPAVQTSNEKDEEVLNLYKAKNDSGFIFEGWTYIQADDGTLRALSAVETDKLNWHAARREVTLLVAEWDGIDIRRLATQLGLWEFVGTKAEGPRGLTGRLIGRDAPIDGSEPRDGSENRHVV
jgi:hypothetical protein